MTRQLDLPPSIPIIEHPINELHARARRGDARPLPIEQFHTAQGAIGRLVTTINTVVGVLEGNRRPFPLDGEDDDINRAIWLLRSQLDPREDTHALKDYIAHRVEHGPAIPVDMLDDVQHGRMGVISKLLELDMGDYIRFYDYHIRPVPPLTLRERLEKALVVLDERGVMNYSTVMAGLVDLEDDHLLIYVEMAERLVAETDD